METAAFARVTNGRQRNEGVHIFNVAFDSWFGGWDGGITSSEPRSFLACRMRSLTPSKCLLCVWWFRVGWSRPLVLS